MVLPATAIVEASPNFLTNLEEAYLFFISQDSDTADSRLIKLKAELRELISILGWSPATGRPARFLRSRSVQSKIRASAILRLAESVGLPVLRECLVGQYIVLYAHSKTEVVLLALKHQKQLGYFVGQ